MRNVSARISALFLKAWCKDKRKQEGYLMLMSFCCASFPCGVENDIES